MGKTKWGRRRNEGRDLNGRREKEKREEKTDSEVFKVN
jgi:hypothetical protein